MVFKLLHEGDHGPTGEKSADVRTRKAAENKAQRLAQCEYGYDENLISMWWFPKVGVPFWGGPFKGILFNLGYKRGPLFWKYPCFVAAQIDAEMASTSTRSNRSSADSAR